MASAQKRRNYVGALCNSQGQWISNSNDIDTEIIEYFQNLFKSDGCNTAEILRCVETKVTSEQNNLLLAPFSAIKVKEALF